MSYLRSAFLTQHNGNNIEAIGAIFNLMDFHKISCCSVDPFLLGLCNGLFRRNETVFSFTSDLDEDDSSVGIDHNKVELAGLAGKVAGESFKAFSFKESFAASLPPLAKGFSVCQEFTSVQQNIHIKINPKS